MNSNEEKDVIQNEQEQEIVQSSEETKSIPATKIPTSREQRQREKPVTREDNPKLFYPMWLAISLFVLTAALTTGGWYFAGEKYLKENSKKIRMEDQLDYYKQKVKMKPDDTRALVELGYTYFMLDNPDEAIKQFERAIQKDKKSYDAYLNIGIVQLNEKNYDEAAEALKKATKIAPADYQGHYYLGLAYLELKMYDEASKALGEANKLQAGSADIIYNIGRIAEVQKDYAAAEQIYKEALSYDPLYKDAQEALERVKEKVK